MRRADSPRSVGLSSALISTMMFLAGIASLNLPNAVGGDPVGAPTASTPFPSVLQIDCVGVWQ